MIDFMYVSRLLQDYKMITSDLHVTRNGLYFQTYARNFQVFFSTDKFFTRQLKFVVCKLRM